MKAKKTLLIGLVAALLLLCIGVFAAQKINNAYNQETQEEETAILLTDFSTSEIESFGYDYQGQSLTFEKREEVVQSDAEESEDASASSEEAETETVWYIADDPEYKINQSTVSSMLTAFVTMQAERELTQVSTEYGLSNPTLSIWVTANGETTRWTCGATNDMTGTIYLQQEGQEGVYLVDSSRVAIFQKTKMDLMDTTDSTADITEDDTQQDTVQQDDLASVEE